MGIQDSEPRRTRGVSRRALIAAGIGAAGVTAGARLPRAVAASLGAPRRAQDAGKLVFLSAQLTPANEAEAMRTEILAGFPGEVEFVPADEKPFLDRVTAEAAAGAGTVGVLGGQHGHFAPLVAQGLLADLRDLAEELDERRFVPDYLVLARFRGEALAYIPWMQASYIMVARREALAHLPDGVDEDALRTSLTYEQLSAWAKNVAGAEGPKLGFPAGEAAQVGTDGLLHRFLQGYAYPSFTRGVNTTFKSREAVAMWQWLKDVWPATNPASLTYAFMQEPLLSGDVWIAWDHTARLLQALRERPDDFVTFPAPRGPAGLGYMPVIAGLAIPKNAPDPAASRALIDYLTQPAVQAITAQAVSFFPTIEAELPDPLPPGIQAEAEAINATLRSDAGIPSLLPVGLGEQNAAYNAVFRSAFKEIVLDGAAIPAVLDTEARNLQAVLDTAKADCWAPDPRSGGVCHVG